MSRQVIMTQKPKRASRERILRAVATSTAIETGESSEAIEARLRSGTSAFKDLKLA